MPPQTQWYQAPPPAYAPPPQGFYGWVPPTNVFPQQPPQDGVFMTEAPPPYPGINPGYQPNGYPPQNGAVGGGYYPPQGGYPPQGYPPQPNNYPPAYPAGPAGGAAGGFRPGGGPFSSAGNCRNR